MENFILLLFPLLTLAAMTVLVLAKLCVFALERYVLRLLKFNYGYASWFKFDFSQNFVSIGRVLAYLFVSASFLSVIVAWLVEFNNRALTQ